MQVEIVFLVVDEKHVPWLKKNMKVLNGIDVECSFFGDRLMLPDVFSPRCSCFGFIFFLLECKRDPTFVEKWHTNQSKLSIHQSFNFNKGGKPFKSLPSLVVLLLVLLVVLIVVNVEEHPHLIFFGY